MNRIYQVLRLSIVNIHCLYEALLGPSPLLRTATRRLLIPFPTVSLCCPLCTVIYCDKHSVSLILSKAVDVSISMAQFFCFAVALMIKACLELARLFKLIVTQGRT